MFNLKILENMKKYDSYVVVDDGCEVIVANCSTLEEAKEELDQIGTYSICYSIYGCVNNEYWDETKL
ncbi:hypothetical protein HMPREF9302_03860 [Prevotella amnii DNF00058]|uniref:Uncharacterized protein n=2 Tax=Prevotella amnii TaxID=419005 RepID=A0A096B013_9BACT|nr:hypothetical protein HMPREF9302_03860 [Prevotella amnii DNF00058]